MSKGPKAKKFSEYDNILNGNPEIVQSVIRRFVSELDFEGWGYSVIDAGTDPPAFARCLVRVWREEKGCVVDDGVGMFTLQLLPHDRTFFHVPPAHKWYYRDWIETPAGKRLSLASLSPSEFYLHVDHSFFIYFLDQLSARFQRLGLKETLAKKLWRLLREVGETAKVLRP